MNPSISTIPTNGLSMDSDSEDEDIKEEKEYDDDHCSNSDKESIVETSSREDDKIDTYGAIQVYARPDFQKNVWHGYSEGASAEKMLALGMFTLGHGIPNDKKEHPAIVLDEDYNCWMTTMTLIPNSKDENFTIGDTGIHPNGRNLLFILTEVAKTLYVAPVSPKPLVAWEVRYRINKAMDLLRELEDMVDESDRAQEKAESIDRKKRLRVIRSGKTPKKEVKN